MKAIMITFDSLNRRFLPTYGNTWVQAPNFRRLEKHSVAFTNCYVGSLPCMPARRELHAGRYNFLHAPWSGLEPYDDSMPEMLNKSGVHTHLVSDHYHYWEDNGNRYHQRYTTWEAVRGQEGDPWIGQVNPPELPDTVDIGGKQGTFRERLVKQDLKNRTHMDSIETHSQTRTFDGGCQFIDMNANDDNWLLHIECFDPHEPFFCPEEFRALYPEEEYSGLEFEWPNYDRVHESEDEVRHARRRYAALLSFCDHSLGRVLSLMDKHSLWEDTMLIVNTDHGYLLGEHGWWAKNRPPAYNEIAHTPLYMWDPTYGVMDVKRESLVQTIDVAPTILRHFGIDPTQDMTGKALQSVIEDDTPVRDAALFGQFGGQVNCTDGRYVYMRAPARVENDPLYAYSLSPPHGVSENLKRAELHEPFSFTKGVPVLSIPMNATFPDQTDNLLFDLFDDPGQQHPIQDERVENTMISHMTDLMKSHDCPADQYERLGLPLP